MAPGPPRLTAGRAGRDWHGSEQRSVGPQFFRRPSGLGWDCCSVWALRGLSGRPSLTVPPRSPVLGRSARASGLPVKVHHREAAKEDLMEVPGLGLLSVTVMFRTSLFAFDKSRLRNTTPSPVPFFQALAESFRSSISQGSWELPSLLRCEQYLTDPSASSSRPIKRPRADSPSA